MRTACVSISFAFTYRNSQILFPLDHLDGSFPCDDPFIILLGTRFCSCYGTEHYIKEGLRGSLMIGSWRIVYPLWCSLGAIVVLDYNRNTCFLYFKKNTTPSPLPITCLFLSELMCCFLSVPAIWRKASEAGSLSVCVLLHCSRQRTAMRQEPVLLKFLFWYSCLHF